MPQPLREGVQHLLRATPAAGLYTLASDEQAWIEEELSMLGERDWTQPLSRKSTAGMSERVVEIPWVISRYHGETRVLDIGTSWAREVYKHKLSTLGVPQLYGVDLSAMPVAGVEMSRADARHMPYRGASFDLVICISTLEHIGLDNAVYGVHSQPAEDGDVAALREFGRVLVPGGRLLLTVPFGRRQRLDWLKQYDQVAWEELLKKASLVAVETAIYGYSDIRGWRRVWADDDLPKSGFQEHGAPAATGVLCAELTTAHG